MLRNLSPIAIAAMLITGCSGGGASSPTPPVPTNAPVTRSAPTAYPAPTAAPTNAPVPTSPPVFVSNGLANQWLYQGATSGMVSKGTFPDITVITGNFPGTLILYIGFNPAYATLTSNDCTGLKWEIGSILAVNINQLYVTVPLGFSAQACTLILGGAPSGSTTLYLTFTPPTPIETPTAAPIQTPTATPT